MRLGGACYGVAIDDLKNECMDPEIEDHYEELLKQWKKDDDNIKDILQEIDRKLEELKASATSASQAKGTFFKNHVLNKIKYNLWSISWLVG